MIEVRAASLSAFTQFTRLVNFFRAPATSPRTPSPASSSVVRALRTSSMSVPLAPTSGSYLQGSVSTTRIRSSGLPSFSPTASRDSSSALISLSTVLFPLPQGPEMPRAIGSSVSSSTASTAVSATAPNARRSVDVGSSDQSWTGLSFTECAPPRSRVHQREAVEKTLQSSLVFGFRIGIPPFCRQPGAGASRIRQDLLLANPRTAARASRSATCRLGQPPELDARLARFVHSKPTWLPLARPWSNEWHRTPRALRQAQ